MTKSKSVNRTGTEYIEFRLPKEIINLYASAKDAILFYELHELTIAPEAATELRDCLDHLMLAIQNHEDVDRYDAELNGALEHLRRASIEPLEYSVENLLANIIKRYKMSLLFKIFFIRQIPKGKYKEKLTAIKEELLQGRKCKNMGKWKKGISHFKKAYALVDDLDFIIPYKDLLYGRIFSVLAALVFFVLGIISQKLI